MPPNDKCAFDGNPLRAGLTKPLTPEMIEAAVKDWSGRRVMPDQPIGYIETKRKPAPKFTSEFVEHLSHLAHHRYRAERAANRARTGAKMLTALQIIDRTNAQITQARVNREMDAALLGDT